MSRRDAVGLGSAVRLYRGPERRRETGKSVVNGASGPGDGRRTIAAAAGKEGDGDTPTVSEIIADKRYIIDHRRRVYAEITGGGLKDSSPAGPPPLFLMGAEYVRYRDAGTEGGLRKYIAETGGEQVAVYFDEEKRLVVRQEFLTAEDSDGARRTAAIFELRNLRPEADEALFQLPAGYRSVPLANIDTRPKSISNK